jgi:hypothetical protein
MTSILTPETGTLRSRLFENKHVGLPLTLFHDIEIPVLIKLPFPLAPAIAADPGFWPARTSVRLDFVQLGIVDWQDLPGREFEFPVNPAPGYVDGSIYFGNEHNWADVTRVAFDRLTENSLMTTVDIAFTFNAAELPPHLPPKSQVRWIVPLVVAESEMRTVLAEAKRRLV